MWIFSTLGGVVGGTRPNPKFYKSVGKRVFLALFVYFCQFLTLFDHKISRNFPHFRGRACLGGMEKSTLFVYFFLKVSLNIMQLLSLLNIIPGLEMLCSKLCLLLWSIYNYRIIRQPPVWKLANWYKWFNCFILYKYINIVTSKLIYTWAWSHIIRVFISVCNGILFSKVGQN